MTTGGTELMKRELCACYSSYNALRSGVVLCRNKQAAHDCVFFEANITILSPSFFFLQLFICSFLSASPYHFVLYYIRCGTRATSPSRCPPHKSTRWVLWAHLVASISLDESWAKLFSFSFSCFSNIYLISSLLILHLPLLYRRRACFCLTTIRTPTFSMRRARATETSATGSTSTTSLTFSPSASMPLKERGS